MTDPVVYYAAVALGVAGAFFGLVAAVGLVRLPDVYTRAHAASKSDTLGAVLSLGAVALAIGSDVATVKIVFLLLFTFLTNPTAAHAVARAALDQDVEPWTRDDTRDDVATDGGPEPGPGIHDEPRSGAHAAADRTDRGPADGDRGDGS